MVKKHNCEQMNHLPKLLWTEQNVEDITKAHNETTTRPINQFKTTETQISSHMLYYQYFSSSNDGDSTCCGCDKMYDKQADLESSSVIISRETSVATTSSAIIPVASPMSNS